MAHDDRSRDPGDANDNNQWTVALRPENRGPDDAQAISDVVLERNRYVAGTATAVDELLVGRRMTSRSATRGAGPAVTDTDGTSTGNCGGYANLPDALCGPYWIQ